jgi:Protein of unknown function (DUF2905)
MNSELIGKVLVVAGICLTVLGGLFYFLGKAGFKGLPGDINIQREGFSFSFPIVTCIVLSIILTVLANLLFRR